MKYIIFVFTNRGLEIAKNLFEEDDEVMLATDMECEYEHSTPDEMIEKMKQIEDKEDYYVIFDDNNVYYRMVKELEFDIELSSKEEEPKEPEMEIKEIECKHKEEMEKIKVEHEQEIIKIRGEIESILKNGTK